MTYGFEREYFVKRGDDFIAAPTDLPKDQCGFLAEARGVHRDTPLEAAFSSLAEEHRIGAKATVLGLTLVTNTPQKLPFKLRRDCARENGKGVQTDFTMSGKWNNPHVQHAGLHVHFGENYDVKQAGL